MNAIRSLPIMNRPSRTTTPAPSFTAPVTGAATVPPLGPPPVPEPNARRPLSQVGAPTSVTGVAPRKNPSPPGSRTGTPRAGHAPLPAVGAEAQGGHVDAIALRFNEAVNRALHGIDGKAKKGFRSGSGWAVGESIAHELDKCDPADKYLLRAILRAAVRSLSIYVSRLDALLMQGLADPLFKSPLNLTPAAHSSPLNAAQAYAVSIAHAAWETCERIEQMLDLDKYPRFVEDTLRPTLDKFDTVVAKVIRPLIQSLRAELENSLDNTAAGGVPKTPAGSMTVPAPSVTPPPLTREKSNPGAPRLSKELSGGGHARSLAVPACLQQFASRVDGARKVLETVAAPCGHDGEGWIAKVAVAVIWRGVRVTMELDSPGSRVPSPGSVHRALSGLGKEATPTVVAAPSLSKITSLSILTPRGSSRPPSPPRHGPHWDPTTHALMSLEGLVKRLVKDLVQPPTAPPSAADSDDQAQEYIAREALHEALEAVESAVVVSAAAHADNSSSRIFASVCRLRDDIDDEADAKLDDALEDLPSVVMFRFLRRLANRSLASVPSETPLSLRPMFQILGLTQPEYERQILSGFGNAENKGPCVAQAIKPEVERMLQTLATMPVDDKESKESLATATEWVRALGVALEARAGVKVSGA